MHVYGVHVKFQKYDFSNSGKFQKTLSMTV